MSRRQTLFAHLALLVTVLSVWSALSRPSAGQAPVEKPTVGRYQVAASTNNSMVVVTDTTNGHTWYRYTSVNEWHDMGSPVK